MSMNDWVAAGALGVLLAIMGVSGWWFLRGRDDTDGEDEQETQTWAVTDAGDRCLTCGDVIDWHDSDDWRRKGWIGHCACCADDHELSDDTPAHEIYPLVPDERGWEEDWSDPDETWVEDLPPVLEFPPIHEHRETVPTRLYVDLSDDPDLLEWDARQQKNRIADIRTHLAMLGAREASWYADRMATVGERLAA